ncbi:hypothetical protein A5692_02190 [Mycobacterium sp. E342]|nr:hypothetical protein A5692_02190 [Mycobacterium sp. E342]
MLPSRTDTATANDGRTNDDVDHHAYAANHHANHHRPAWSAFRGGRHRLATRIGAYEDGQ